METLNSQKHISFLMGVFILATVYALVLSVFGPVLDHHYAERQPDHRHIYLEDVVSDHIHPYEVPHTNFHIQGYGRGTSTEASSSVHNPAQALFLTSYSGMNQVITQLITPLGHLVLNYSGKEDHRLAFNISEDNTFFQSAFVAPPKKPPRG